MVPDNSILREFRRLDLKDFRVGAFEGLETVSGPSRRSSLVTVRILKRVSAHDVTREVSAKKHVGRSLGDR